MILAHFFHLSLSGLDGRAKPSYLLITYQAMFAPQGKIAYLGFRTETPSSRPSASPGTSSASREDNASEAIPGPRRDAILSSHTDGPPPPV